MKWRDLSKSWNTPDQSRVEGNLPLITDTTELISPEIAEQILQHNESNRPVNWRQAEEYAEVMRNGEWKFHGQGIIIDSNGNLLTGQQRLWGVILSGKSVYMRVSRGTPPDAGKYIDRGRQQSARDLASRTSGKKHSPIEASIARGFCVLCGNSKPTKDDIGNAISARLDVVSMLLTEAYRTKKTRSVLMVLSVLATLDFEKAKALTIDIEKFAKRLESALYPETAEKCWGRGVAFRIALEQAKKIVGV